MTTQNRQKTEDTERIREQAFSEGYEAGFQAAREKYSLTKEPLPEAALEYARRVYRLDGVERVYARVYMDDTMDLWTVISEHDEVLRRGIRDIEKHIWDNFPYHVFDFGILGPMNLRILYSENVLIGTGFAFVPREAPVAIG